MTRTILTFVAAIAAALALSMLAACGGGGDPVYSGPPRTVQMFGDSVQDLEFPTVHASLGARATDRAAHGSNSAMLLAGTDGVNAPWPQSVAAEVVVINHGSNDAAVGPTQTELAQYAANLRRLAVAPALVVFETPIPAWKNRPNLDAYAQVMREVAAETGTPLIDVHRCVKEDMSNWTAMIPDGVHPTPEGASAIVSTCVLPNLKVYTN